MCRLQQLHQNTVRDMKEELQNMQGVLSEDIESLRTQENVDDDDPDWTKLEADLHVEVHKRLVDKTLWKLSKTRVAMLLSQNKRLLGKIDPFSQVQELRKRRQVVS